MGIDLVGEMLTCQILPQLGKHHPTRTAIPTRILRMMLQSVANGNFSVPLVDFPEGQTAPSALCTVPRSNHPWHKKNAAKEVRSANPQS